MLQNTKMKIFILVYENQQKFFFSKFPVSTVKPVNHSQNYNHTGIADFKNTFIYTRVFVISFCVYL